MAHLFKKILSPLLLSAKDTDGIKSIIVSAAMKFSAAFIALYASNGTSVCFA